MSGYCHSSGIVPSRLGGFFPHPSEHHNWRGKKAQSKPRGDNHTLTKEIIMFCRRAGQLHVSDTNVTRLSAPLVLHAEVMCLCVNYFATALSDRAEPLDRTS